MNDGGRHAPDGRHRRRGVHRVAPRRAAARRRPRGRRHRLLRGLLPAAASRKANIAGRASRGASPWSRRTSCGMAGDAGADGSRLDEVLAGADCVFHLAAQAGRARQLGSELPHLHRQQRARHADGPRGVPPGGRAQGRLRLVVVGLRRHRPAAHARGRQLPPGLALRRHQARRRAALPPVLEEPRRAHGLPALLHGLRAAPAPGHGLPPVPEGAARGSPAGDVRHRQPDAGLHLRRRHRRRASCAPSTGWTARSTTSAAGPASRCWRRSARSRACPASRPRCAARTCRPATCKHTWADLGRAREELGYAPQVPLEEGLRREAEWFHDLWTGSPGGA